RSAGSRAATLARPRPGALLGLRVHGFTELHRRLRERVGLGADRLGIVALDGFLQIGDAILDRPPLRFADLGAVLSKPAFGGVDAGLGLVLRLDLRLALLVFLGVRLGVLHHTLDVAFAQAARGLDANLLLFAGRLVARGNIDDAVGVDVESDLDLWHAARRHRDADQVELAEHFVVARH